MLSLIRVKGFKSIIYNIDEYITILIYIEGELLDESSIIAKMIMKIYLIDNLKANIFIDNNVFISQKIKLDLINNKIIIEIYQNLAIKIDIVIKENFNIRRIIRFKKTVIISALFTLFIFITY